MYSNITLRKMKSLLNKALLTAALAVSGQFLFAQCVTPATSTICLGQIKQLTANTGGGGTFTQSTQVNMPAGQPGTTSGNFGPYPSTVAVTGLPTSGISVASVQLNGMNHTWTSDLDIVLVSPTGQYVILVSDAAGGADLINANIVFKDGFPAVAATGTVVPSGTYRPTNAAGPDNFPAPGPGSITQVNPVLTTFTGNMNGTWSLYGVDQFGGDYGFITSWSITFSSGITTTWTGPAGTIFTNPAATTPYVAGSDATDVYVKPTATGANVYTATISSGACAGSNNATVNVNPLPTVAITPAVSCASTTNTLTASGANTYTWTPAAGLSSTSGATVTANPTATTTYTVTGTNTATGCQNTATALVNSRPTASVLSSPAAFIYQINEGFDAAPAGWLIQNNSNPVGTTSWFLNTSAVFPAFDGAATAAAGANFNSGSGTSNISTWLFTPQVNIKNGDVFSFYTRTAANPATYPDNLEARMSLNGASTNVGTTATSVGDFSTLLVAINPGLTLTGYPGTWTKYSVTISGVTGTVPGRFAFRYVVPNGGPLGANSDFIGLDRVQYGTPPAANCANNVNNLAVNITGGDGPYNIVYSDGTSNYTYNNYTSGSNINVAPAVTTTYTLVSVTSAAGCTGINNSGTVTITVTPPASIATQPAAVTNACVTGGTATISVVSSPATAPTNTYQWQVSTDGGATYTDIANGGMYSGATTSTLSITGATAAMQGYLYRVKVFGYCGPTGGVISTASSLSVNTPAVITAPTANGNFTACTGSTTSTTNTTTLSVTATGNALTYQWQVSTNGGTTFNNVANGANYAGATTSTLSIINPPSTFVNNQYRVLVSSGGCAAVTSAVQTLTAVNSLPVVTVSASPNTSLSPATPVVLTAAVSSATAPISYQWYWNNMLIVGATGATYTVDPNQPGDYTVTVKDANGCNAVTSTPITLTLVTNPSTVLFISPSPNNGVFYVRYFNSKATPTAREYAMLNVYDDKGTRVFTQRYSLSGPYTRMAVDLGVHSGGIYRVELSDGQGNRLQTGSVLVY